MKKVCIGFLFFGLLLASQALAGGGTIGVRKAAFSTITQFQQASAIIDQATASTKIITATAFLAASKNATERKVYIQVVNTIDHISSGVYELFTTDGSKISKLEFEQYYVTITLTDTHDECTGSGMMDSECEKVTGPRTEQAVLMIAPDGQPCFLY